MTHFHRYSELTSTNTELARLADLGAPHATVVSCHTQSAGRGQRGNTWESTPGLNVTLSILLRPEGIHPRNQFCISEAVALAVARTLDGYLPPEMRAEVKWPNDIYVGDRKICGILIENRISATEIDRSIAGIGLNINQPRFLSDAPNPVSLLQLTGRTHSVREIEEQLADNVVTLAARAPELHDQYMARLWRRTGLHPYAEPGGTPFLAEIASVAPTGHLTLRRADSTLSTYAFKEVQALLPSPAQQIR